MAVKGSCKANRLAEDKIRIANMSTSVKVIANETRMYGPQ